MVHVGLEDKFQSFKCNAKNAFKIDDIIETDKQQVLILMHPQPVCSQFVF